MMEELYDLQMVYMVTFGLNRIQYPNLASVFPLRVRFVRFKS